MCDTSLLPTNIPLGFAYTILTSHLSENDIATSSFNLDGLRQKTRLQGAQTVLQDVDFDLWKALYEAGSQFSGT